MLSLGAADVAPPESASPEAQSFYEQARAALPDRDALQRLLDEAIEPIPFRGSVRAQGRELRGGRSPPRLGAPTTLRRHCALRARGKQRAKGDRARPEPHRRIHRARTRASAILALGRGPRRLRAALELDPRAQRRCSTGSGSTRSRAVTTRPSLRQGVVSRSTRCRERASRPRARARIRGHSGARGGRAREQCASSMRASRSVTSTSR